MKKSICVRISREKKREKKGKTLVKDGDVDIIIYQGEDQTGKNALYEASDLFI